MWNITSYSTGNDQATVSICIDLVLRSETNTLQIKQLEDDFQFTWICTPTVSYQQKFNKVFDDVLNELFRLIEEEELEEVMRSN